jgi:hypothetical protein
MKEFSSIDTFVKEHLRDVQMASDYRGKDELGYPIYCHDRPYPTLTYTALHKIGGTNCGIFLRNGEIGFQSRSRELVSEDQNGFKAYFSLYTKVLEKLFTEIKQMYNTNSNNINIWGEWCGSGIKDRHSISKLGHKVWIVFSIAIDGVKQPLNKHICNHTINCYNILEWGSHTISINYADFPEGAWKNDAILPDYLQKWVDDLTLECPVSKSFGIVGLGEGMVLTSNELSPRTGEPYLVKLKNSLYDKVVIAPLEKTLNPNVDLYVAKMVTGARLTQWFDSLSNTNTLLDMKLVKSFQDLLIADCVKEGQIWETEYNITQKEWEPAVRKASTNFFKEQLSK